MKFSQDTNWEEIFSKWQEREANNPNWVHCATIIKGWPDWESWRRFTGEQIQAQKRTWKVFKFSDPINEVPAMALGPYSGWQADLPEKNKLTFSKLLEIPVKFEFYSNAPGLVSMMNDLPFNTEFIGIRRLDNNQIVCIEGHHRATAIALAQKLGKPIDFSNTNISIALFDLPVEEIDLFDNMLARGTSRNPK